MIIWDDTLKYYVILAFWNMYGVSPREQFSCIFRTRSIQDWWLHCITRSRPDHRRWTACRWHFPTSSSSHHPRSGSVSRRTRWWVHHTIWSLQPSGTWSGRSRNASSTSCRSRGRGRPTRWRHIRSFQWWGRTRWWWCALMTMVLIRME